MTPRVFELLRARHESTGRPSDGWVFPCLSSTWKFKNGRTTRCAHFNGDAAKEHHKKALIDSGVKAFVPYVLRHTALTNLGEAARVCKTAPLCCYAAQALLDSSHDSRRRKYLRMLSNEGARIRIITNRLFIRYFHNFAISQTVEWLDHHGIPYWDLCFMNGKEQVGADIYIDDTRAEHTESVRARHVHNLLREQHESQCRTLVLNLGRKFTN